MKIKKLGASFLAAALVPLIMASCQKDFLDQSPESGLDTDEVFGKYDNFKRFLRRHLRRYQVGRYHLAGL